MSKRQPAKPAPFAVGDRVQLGEKYRSIDGIPAGPGTVRLAEPVPYPVIQVEFDTVPGIAYHLPAFTLERVPPSEGPWPDPGTVAPPS